MTKLTIELEDDMFTVEVEMNDTNENREFAMEHFKAMHISNDTIKAGYMTAELKKSYINILIDYMGTLD